MTSGSTLILLVILHLIIVATADQVGKETEFDYLNNTGKGPTSWGSLKSEFSACGNGKSQSPVDLTVNGRVDTVPQLETVTRQYKASSDSVLINRGTSVELQWVDGGHILFRGREYKLTNTHWHSPSEHAINGNKYDLEMHVVHADDEKPRTFAVISNLYKIGQAPDPFLAKLQPNISTFVTVKTVKEIKRGVMDPNDIGMSVKEFYRYEGSLTTPPCTERVTWTVEQQVKTVSADQVNMLREAVNDDSQMNARPLQQLNGRDVRHYVDHFA